MDAAAVAEHYADFAADYDRTVLGEYRYVAAERVPAMLLAAAGAAAPPRMRVLDLGCGTGLSSAAFVARGDSVAGVDASAEMLREARGLAVKACADIEAPLPAEVAAAGPFDAAVMLGVLEFVRDPPALFRRVRAHLAPGGLFGLAFPRKAPPRVERALGVRTYAREALLAEVAAAGFEAVGEAEDMHGYTCGEDTIEYTGCVFRCVGGGGSSGGGESGGEAAGASE